MYILMVMKYPTDAPEGRHYEAASLKVNLRAETVLSMQLMRISFVPSSSISPVSILMIQALVSNSMRT